MTDFFLPYEIDLFFMINGTHSRFLDCVMWLYSGMAVWMPVIAGLLFVLIYGKSWREWLPLLLSIALLVLISHEITDSVIKPLVARPRPADYPGIMESVRTFGRQPGWDTGYGFVSGHAANTFGLAVFTALLFRNRLYTFVVLAWALLMGYSRVYLGVHFVSDIVGGILVGWVAGFCIHRLYCLAVKRLRAQHPDFLAALYPHRSVNIFAGAMAVYIVAFALLSPFIVTYFYRL